VTADVLDVRDLGVVANFDNIDILFGDNNPGNSADWLYSVYYATLI
jgi:hypothetical protein